MFDRQAALFGMETSKARSISSTLRRLWAYFRRYYFRLLLIAVAVLASTYMQVLIPDLTGQAVDCYLVPYGARTLGGNLPGAIPVDELPISGNLQESGAATNCWFTTLDLDATAGETIAGLGSLVLLIVGLYVGSAVLSGVQFYLMSWIGFHVLRDMQANIFHQIHRLTLGFFTRTESGDIMSRVTNDIDAIQQVIGFGIISVLQGILLIGWIVIRMARLNVPFSIISLSMLPLMFIATRWFSGQARKAFRRARLEIGSVNADLQENIAAVREVQAFGREEENIEQFRSSNAANRDANIKAQAYSTALAPTLEAFSYVNLALVAVVGGLVIVSGGTLLGTTISIGLIITFIAYTQQFNRPVQQISVLWTNIQSAIAGAERVFDLLDEQPDINDKPDAPPLPTIKGEVLFSNVWAEYTPGEPVIKGINIKARPGDTVAIVGPTGAGKTTIINLLPRFWDVTAGQVVIDGYDVRDVTRSSVRNQIGMVLQDTFLFSDTVMNNIRYGQPDATDEEVTKAAKLARAHNFITLLENGYETVLGERGIGLSLGQRQLLAIARVVLSNPRILVLDEATSSVDTRTERQIQEALDQLLSGRTSFVIAHRLSTIRNADQVLVLDKGQIIERGTHDELLDANGFYYDLYMSQFRREEESTEDEPGDFAAEGAFFVPGD